MKMLPALVVSVLFLTLVSADLPEMAYKSENKNLTPAGPGGLATPVNPAAVLADLAFTGKAHSKFSAGLSIEESTGTSPLADTSKILGKRIFLSNCRACHNDSAGTLAPGQTILSSMTPNSIYQSLLNGKMQIQGKAISDVEKAAVAEYLTGFKVANSKMPDSVFTKFNINNTKPAVSEHSGWGNDLASTGFRPAKASGITPANVTTLKLKWSLALPYQSIMRTKPAIIDDWMIIGTQFGDVYALNRFTGKIGWHFAASSSIRGAITVERKAKQVIAYFADFSTNTYALDVTTGKMIWSSRAGLDNLSAVTGAVAVHNGKVYVPITSQEVGLAASGTYDCCFSSGGLVALDALTGKKIWSHRTVQEKAKAAGNKKNGKPFYGPSGAPVWASPTVDAKRGLVYIGTGENYSNPTTSSSDAIQAIDMKTGKLVWNFQATERDAYNVACPMFVNCPEKSGPDFDFGMSPMLVKTTGGKDILIAGQKSGVVHALSPSDGKIIWQTRVGKGGMLGGIHWGMASDNRYVYAANSDNPAALDRRDTSLKASPGLYALDIATGKLAWKAASPDCAKPGCINGNSAAPVSTDGLVFAGSLNGFIRAHSAVDGKVLWEFNTAINYESLFGIKGKGGAIDGPAPVLADGFLYVNSGYGMFGQMGGNVLLAFEVARN